MAVRRNYRPRRGDPEVLARAWVEALETGHDHFGDLADLTGLAEPATAGLPASPEHAEAKRLWMDAARAAWAQYGDRVMAYRDPDARPPWAVDAFGPPPGFAEG